MAPHREAEEVQEDEEPRSADDDGEDRKPAAAARRNKKSKRKFKVFDESGLTDAQRRALRQEQRGLQAGLKAGEHGTLEDLQEAREKNNELFDQVRYTREAVLDADNVDMIVTQYAQKVEKDVQVPRFDPLKLVHKLKQKCSGKTETGKYFDWKLLGVECGICFNALPDRVSFLAGALDHEVHIKAQKPRKKRAANVPGEDEKDAINPEKVDNNDNNRSDGADKLSAMEKNMRTLKKTLTKKHKAQVDAGGPNEIDAVKFLFNPKSFTQTVENIFNFSFLIKKGEAELDVRPRNNNALGADGQEPPPPQGSGLVLAPRLPSSSDEDGAAEQESTQSVLAFTMKDWRRMCAENFAPGEEGALPHRTGSKIPKHTHNSEA